MNVASSMRHHTKGIESIEIKAPSTAVKPQIKTIRCK